MNYIKSIFYVGYAVILLSSFMVGQRSDDVKPPLLMACDGLEKSEDVTNWRRVVLGGISICIPTNLREIKQRCFDGGCYRFENEEFVLTADLDPAAGRPTSQKRYPSYNEQYTKVDGKPAWIWYFERTGEYKGNSGINIKLKEDGEYVMGLYLYSKEAGNHKLANKIFNTIRFLPFPTNPEK